MASRSEVALKHSILHAQSKSIVLSYCFAHAKFLEFQVHSFSFAKRAFYPKTKRLQLIYEMCSHKTFQ